MQQHFLHSSKHRLMGNDNILTQRTLALSYSGGLVENGYSQFPNKSEFYAPEVSFCQYCRTAFGM